VQCRRAGRAKLGRGDVRVSRRQIKDRGCERPGSSTCRDVTEGKRRRETAACWNTGVSQARAGEAIKKRTYQPGNGDRNSRGGSGSLRPAREDERTTSAGWGLHRDGPSRADCSRLCAYNPASETTVSKCHPSFVAGRLAVQGKLKTGSRKYGGGGGGSGGQARATNHLERAVRIYGAYSPAADTGICTCA
jgi:hypothetical protein